MPTFQYEAMNSVGKSVKSSVEAASSEDAITKIRAMGNFPTKIKEVAGKSGKAKRGGASSAGAAGASPARKSARRVGKVPAKLLTQFTRQLSTLQNAGLPILRALRILEEQQKPGAMRIAVRLVAEDVEAGSSLSESMARHPKAFDRLYTNMIRAGELGTIHGNIRSYWYSRAKPVLARVRARRYAKKYGSMISQFVTMVCEQ